MSQNRRAPRGHDLYLDVWHRRDSLQRFVGQQRATWMSLIDIDCCEYCHLGGCLEPVALIETKLVWSSEKTITVTRNLARRANLTGAVFLVEYATVRETSLCDQCGRPDADLDNDISYFIVTDGSVERSAGREMSPAEYAEWLWMLRFPHWQQECANPARSKMLAWPALHAA